MKTSQLVVIGGFLGAGKTTSILNMAKHLINSGLKVGIVTNDQGSNLVDTNYLASQGLPVFEVTGGCFCCNFDEFSKKLGELAETKMPDIILAEPVGSCTDLIATIFKPMQTLSLGNVSLKPLSIVVDPRRAKKLMMEQNSSPFPDEINYLFAKQLEEADIIVLNKIDIIDPKEAEEIITYLKNHFKGTDIIAVSAKNNENIDNWASLIADTNPSFKHIKDLNYNTYGRAEEYLGWYNSSISLKCNLLCDINSIIKYILDELKEKFIESRIEIAHLKVYGISDNDWAKASITTVDEAINFDRNMQSLTSSSNLVINARINADPSVLIPIVNKVLDNAAQKYNLILDHLKMECFKPGFPNPKYRMKN